MKIRIDKKGKKIILGLVVILVVTGGFGIYKRSSVKTAGRQAGMADTAVVTKMDLVSELSSTGVLKPKDTYNVTSLVEGEVTKADFEVGSRVEKGQILYLIDVSNAEAELKSAKGALERADRSSQEAEKDYRQAKDKYGNGTYVSGDTGYIKKLYFQAGEKVSAGTKLADLYDDRVMKLRVPFLSAEAEAIPVGSQGVVTLAATQEQLPAVVAAVSHKDETLTGGRLVRYVTFKVQNPGGLTADQSAVAAVGDYTASIEGTFQPSEESVMYAELPDGVTVDQLLVAEGDYVGKGTPVFHFDAQSSDKIMRTYRDALDRAKDGLDGAMSKIDSTRNNLDNYTITAPISGTVIKKNIKAGDKMSKSGDSSAMAVIYDLSAITFSMSVDELDISKVKEGQQVKITADAAGGKTYEGTVSNVSLESASSNGITTYPVSVTVKDPQGLLPGMNVNGRIRLAESKEALVVPADSLLRGNVVYVSDSTVKEARGAIPAGFREVTVETGIISSDYIEIKSGLSQGDVVYRVPGGSSAANTGDGEGSTDMDMDMDM